MMVVIGELYNLRVLLFVPNGFKATEANDTKAMVDKADDAMKGDIAGYEYIVQLLFIIRNELEIFSPMKGDIAGYEYIVQLMIGGRAEAVVGGETRVCTIT